jgi:hypothetical protein
VIYTDGVVDAVNERGEFYGEPRLREQIVAEADRMARRLGRPVLELGTRVELTENHATFARLGFREVARTAHPGYDRPTSVTMERPVDPV